MPRIPSYEGHLEALGDDESTSDGHGTPDSAAGAPGHSGPTHDALHLGASHRELEAARGEAKAALALAESLRQEAFGRRQEASMLRKALEDSATEVSRLETAHADCVRERDRYWKLLSEQKTFVARVKGETGLEGVPLEELRPLQSTLEASLERVRRACTEAEVRQRIDAEMNERRTEVPEDQACVVCTERVKEVILLPCKHRCLCQVCADKVGLGLCPMCRTPIEELIVPF